MQEELTVNIPYTVDTGENLVNETFGPNNIRRRKTGTNDLRTMTVRNGRMLADRFSLDENGFVFVEHKTKVADFFDAEQLQAVYYPEVEQLIKAVSGALRVVIFDHTLRSGEEAEREAKLIREPVLSAHNDYTEWSGPNRVREVLPDEADDLIKRRFAIIQVWRAINQPIQSNPLALADAKSVAMEDLLIAERRYPHRVGQTYRLKYSPDHRAGFIFLSAATRPWFSKFTIQKKTAGRASRRTRPSRIRPRRRTRARDRASKCALSRFSHRNPDSPLG